MDDEYLLKNSPHFCGDPNDTESVLWVSVINEHYVLLTEKAHEHYCIEKTQKDMKRRHL